MYTPSLEQYKAFNKPYDGVAAGEDIDGDTFDTLEAWHRYPHKCEVMAEAMRFKEHLRKISYVKWFRDAKRLNRLGLPDRSFYRFSTPIIHSTSSKTVYKMDALLREFEKCVSADATDFECPASLVKTELGQTILSELQQASFTENVFCHNALYYKSFVVKGSKLVGIRNWQHAGYFPPEFEDVVHPHLERIS